jgi:hypothetical protein
MLLTLAILVCIFAGWMILTGQFLGFCLMMWQSLVCVGIVFALVFIARDWALAARDWALAYPTLANWLADWILLPCGVLLVPVLVVAGIRRIRHGAVIGAPDDYSDETILKRRHWAARAVSRRERLRARLPDWARWVFPPIRPWPLELTSDERIQAREKERLDALARWQKEADERWPPPEWLRRDPRALSRLLEEERRHGAQPHTRWPQRSPLRASVVPQSSTVRNCSAAGP